jgi:hypothetical protein
MTLHLKNMVPEKKARMILEKRNISRFPQLKLP